MTDLITTEHALSEDQQVLLAALLDTLVPASGDGRMPSAADVDFGTYLRTQAEDFVTDLRTMLSLFDPSFATLALPDRCERLAEFSTQHPALFRGLLTRAYDCYYQDDRVRRQIGVVTGAPFPQGNEVTAGDLSLLDPVIGNRDRHTYRKA